MDYNPLDMTEKLRKDKKFVGDLQSYYADNKQLDNLFLEEAQTRKNNFDKTDSKLWKEINDEENNKARADERVKLIENYFINQKKFESFQKAVSNTINNTIKNGGDSSLKSVNNMLKYIGNEDGRAYWNYLELPFVKKDELQDKIIGKSEGNDNIAGRIKESAGAIGKYLNEKLEKKEKKAQKAEDNDKDDDDKKNKTDDSGSDTTPLPSEPSTEDFKDAKDSAFNNKYLNLSTEKITEAIKTMSADYDGKLLERQDKLDDACRKELSELYAQAGRLSIQLDPLDNSNDNKNQNQSKKYLVSLNAIVQSTIAARQKAAASKRPPIPLARPPIQSNAGPKEQNNNAQTHSSTPENTQTENATSTVPLLPPPPIAQSTPPMPTTAPPPISAQEPNVNPSVPLLPPPPIAQSTPPMPTKPPPARRAEAAGANPPASTLPTRPNPQMPATRPPSRRAEAASVNPPASTLPTRPNPQMPATRPPSRRAEAASVNPQVPLLPAPPSTPQMPTTPPPALNQPTTKQPRPPMPLPSEIQAAKDKLANEFRKRSEERAAAKIAPTKEEKSILDFSWKKFSPSTKADFEAAKAKIIEKYCKQLERDYRKLKSEFRNEQMDAFTALRGKKRFERKEAEEFRTSQKNISDAETSQYNFDISIDQFFKEIMRKIVPPPERRPNLAPRAVKKEEAPPAITDGSESDDESESGESGGTDATKDNETVNEEPVYIPDHKFRNILTGKMYQTNFLEKTGASLLYLYQQMDDEQQGKDKTDGILSSMGKKAKFLWSKVKNKLGGKKEKKANEESTEEESTEEERKSSDSDSENQTAENKEPKNYNVSGNRKCFSKNDLRNIIVSSQPTQDSNVFNLRKVYQKEFIEDRSKQDGMDVKKVTENYFKGAYGKRGYDKPQHSAGVEKIYNYTRALLRAYIVLKSGAKPKPTGVPAEQTSTINQCSDIDTYRKFVKTIGQQIGRQNGNILIETCKKYLKDFMKKCESELSGKDKDKDKSNYYEYLKECFDDVIGNRELPKKTLQNALKNVLDSETGIKNMIKEETWLFAGEATSEMNIEASNANKSVKESN